MAQTIVEENHRKQIEELLEATIELLVLIMETIRDTKKYLIKPIYQNQLFESYSKIILRSCMGYCNKIYKMYYSQLDDLRNMIFRCNDEKYGKKMLNKINNKIKKVEEKYFIMYGIDTKAMKINAINWLRGVEERIVEREVEEVEENPIISE